MVSDEEVLEKLNDEYNTDEDVAKLMAELNLDEELNFPTESDTEISEEEEDAFPEFNEEDLSVPDEFNADESDLETSDESMDEIPSEEILDMDEIDAILSDVSDIHPERKVSAEELEERIAKYEENPEAAEEALLQGNEEETSGEDAGSSESKEAETSGDTESAAAMDEDFLMNLENVDEMLADVENKANEESERLKAEREAAEGDSDLDEINDILHKSDNNEAVNDELLSMIAGIDKEDDNEPEGMFDEEGDGEEDDKKKKKAKKEKEKKKKKKKGKGESEEETEGAEGEEGASEDSDLEFDDKEKPKGGLFAKLFGFMFEEDEEEEKEGEGENPEEGDKGKGKKKDKKGKKGKKGKSDAPVDENAAIEAELEEEDKKDKKKKDKKKKEKAPKPKKEKKEKKEEEQENTKSGIKTPGIVVSMLFCLTILGIVLLLAIGGSGLLSRNEAKLAYYKGDYETASNKLYGLKLNKSDELIYKKASLLYRLELFIDKADAYKALGDEKKTADALFAAYEECGKVYPDATDLGITKEVDLYREKIVEEISSRYGLNQEQIDEISQLKPVHYTIAIENIASGFGYTLENTQPTENENITVDENETEETNELEDLLPEEELINVEGDI